MQSVPNLPTLHQLPAKCVSAAIPSSARPFLIGGQIVAIPGAGAFHEYQRDEHWNFDYNPSSREKHPQLSELASGRGKDIPSGISYSHIADFFLERKFRKSEAEKVIQIPWQVNTTFCKARGPRVLQKNTPTTEMARKGWFRKSQHRTGRQHKAAVCCSQPVATLTRLQEVSFLSIPAKQWHLATGYEKALGWQGFLRAGIT